MASADGGPGVDEEIYRTRDRTYHGFLHMARWFVIHTALLLLGLYLWALHDSLVGVVLGVASLLALGYGAVSTPRAAAKQSMSDRLRGAGERGRRPAA